ncbi:MAG: hypothetical protein Q4D76_10980 [Oscillospiraceae bacterium]|nr:hypothetical protein [Oscillospiraceae bacterium]
MFTSCGVKSYNLSSQETVTSLPEQTAVSFEMTTTTNATDLPAGISTADYDFLMNEPYLFSEVDSVLGPGPFSVNKLSEIFGEPISVYGYYSSDGFGVISIMFEDVMFDLTANHGEKLDLEPTEDSRYYKVPNSAMDIQMEVQYSCVFNGNCRLPRGIKLGDSIESLYNAYNGNRGKERSAQGEFLVSYKYGESGSIIYHFDDTNSDGVTSGIKQVTIEWYSMNNPNESIQSKNAPPA